MIKIYCALALTVLAIGFGGCDSGGVSYSQTSTFDCVELDCTVSYTIENHADRAVVFDYNMRLSQSMADGKKMNEPIEVGAMSGQFSLEPYEKLEGALATTVETVPNTLDFSMVSVGR